MALQTVTLLTINDVYASRPSGEDELGGLAELATLLDRERASAAAENRAVILCLNGDLLGGSSAAVRHQGANVIRVLNALLEPTDLCVVGNHELDFGLAVFEERVAESHFRWLGGNVRYTATGEVVTGLHEAVTLQLGDVRVGFFGVCTEETPELSHPGPDVCFAPFLDQCVEGARKAREEQGAEVLVALTHLRMSEDRSVARAIPDLPVLLGGHEHYPFTTVAHHTLLHKSGQNAEYLGRIDLALTRKEDGTVGCVPSWRMIAVQGIPPRADVKALIDEAELVDETHIMTVTTRLDTRTAVVRAHEANSGNMIADAFRAIADTDVGIINGGFLRGNRLYAAPHEYTEATHSEELPFPIPLVRVRITGDALRRAFEQMLRHLPEPAGCFPHVSGLRVLYDPALPPLQRIVEFSVGTLASGFAPVQPEQWLTTATTRFVVEGGDGCDAFLECVREDDVFPPQLTADALSAYWSSEAVGPEVAPQVEGRLGPVDTP